MPFKIGSTKKSYNLFDMNQKEINLLFSIIDKELGIKRDVVTSKSRKGEIVDARRIFSVICKKNSKLSLKKIGGHLGGRDHATILSAIKKHNDFYKTNKDYIYKFDKVNHSFLSSNIMSEKIVTSIRDLKYRKTNVLKQLERDIYKLRNNYDEEKSNNLNVGLFFGSFNPVHNGHMIIANTALHECGFDEVWFVVAGESPDKVGLNDMLSVKERFDLIKSSIIDNPFLKVSDIENKLEKPCYTHVTLGEFRKKYPNYTFSVIIGSDNLCNFEEWKNYESILMHHSIFYFERPNCDILALRISEKKFNAKKINNIAEIDISSTGIRNLIRSGGNIEKLRYLIPDECLYLIEKNKYYKEELIKK